MRFHQSHASHGGGALFVPTHSGQSVVMLSLSSYTYEWKMGAEQTFLLNVLCSDKCQFSFIGKFPV